MNVTLIDVSPYKVGILPPAELREYDSGDWSGASRSEILNDDVRLRMAYFSKTFLPPGGESMTQVERRASKWLEDNILYNQSLNFKKNNIIIFSHGLTIKCLLNYIMGFDSNFIWKISIDNTSVTKLSFGKEGWKLHYINDTSHLL